MSDAAPKPKTREALRRAGDGEQITHRELARRAGVGFEEVRRAIFRRTDAERAGKICVALGEMAGLTPAERREIFAELIHSPGGELVADCIPGSEDCENRDCPSTGT